MSNKIIVDDYYSQINPNDSEVKKIPVKKPVLATKKKIVVRKATEIKAEEAIKEEKKLNDIKNNFKQST
ncbi:hypothetical protein GW891_03745 [bacterium]|nr:hypothetical protein [bacterium]